MDSSLFAGARPGAFIAYDMVALWAMAGVVAICAIIGVIMTVFQSANDISDSREVRRTIGPQPVEGAEINFELTSTEKALIGAYAEIGLLFGVCVGYIVKVTALRLSHSY